MPYGSPNAEYNAILDFIKKGFPVFELKARKLAVAHNIDMKDLPEAVKTGENNLLLSYASLLAQGRKDFIEEKAERLATKLRVNLDQLVEDIIINSAPI